METVSDEVVMTPGRHPGWSPTAGADSYTFPPTDIQRFGALRESIPQVWERFSVVLRGLQGGVPSVAQLFLSNVGLRCGREDEAKTGPCIVHLVCAHIWARS